MNLSLVIACALLGTTIVLGSSVRYPWGDPMALGPELLINTEGNTGNTNALLANVNTIALYFSAHCCPPCQEFTPILKTVYERSWRKQGIEVIFISWDQSQPAFKEYYKTMPWLASPFGKNGHLQGYFDVQGIPSLVLLDAQTNKVITKGGRELAMDVFNNGKALTFGIHGLINNTQWNGRECSISFNESTNQLLASVKISFKAGNLKPKDENVIGDCNLESGICTYELKLGMNVIVYGTKVPKLNELAGQIVEKKTEERYIVLFQFAISAKNLNLVL